MSLTIPQRQTLKAAMLLVPAMAAAIAAGDTYSMLQWCNTSSTVSAWRNNVIGAEIYAAHKPKEYMARSATERQCFDLMVLQGSELNFTVGKIRNAISDIFSGTTNQTSRTTIFAVAQELATNAESKLGGANASVGGTADMAETVTAFVRDWIGEVEQEDVSWMLVNNLV
jgi:hypothetical protein